MSQFHFHIHMSSKFIHTSKSATAGGIVEASLDLPPCITVVCREEAKGKLEVLADCHDSSRFSNAHTSWETRRSDWSRDSYLWKGWEKVIVRSSYKIHISSRRGGLTTCTSSLKGTLPYPWRDTHNIHVCTLLSVCPWRQLWMLQSPPASALASQQLQ